MCRYWTNPKLSIYCSLRGGFSLLRRRHFREECHACMHVCVLVLSLLLPFAGTATRAMCVHMYELSQPEENSIFSVSSGTVVHTETGRLVIVLQGILGGFYMGMDRCRLCESKLSGNVRVFAHEYISKF